MGTDLIPTITLAYEEAEDSIMNSKPRTEHDHLVSGKCLLISYGLIGQFENFASFFAFYWVFYDHGETITSTVGSGVDWRKKYELLDDERKEFFGNMCNNNKFYQ